MRISEKDLRAQFDRAIVNWDWIRQAEDQLGVPPFLLYALGSRETNLRNVVSADGHGHGIWQRDDRSFTIPATYAQTPLLQATDAATLLMSHFGRFRTAWPGLAWPGAVAAYNAGYGGVTKKLVAGQPADAATTGGDYGADVLERWSFLVAWGHARL